VLIFAVLALVLAAIGVLHVAAVAVTLRAREMGIRLAIGAEARAIVRLVLREQVILGVVGGAIGLVAALAAGRLIQALLYDVGGTDPRATLVAVAALNAAVIIRACPLDASRVNSADLLRRE
jgi:putative ABC transport system permease protein